MNGPNDPQNDSRKKGRGHRRPQIRIETNESDSEKEFWQRAKDHLHSISSALASFVLHATLIAILAFFVYSERKQGHSNLINAEVVEISKPVTNAPDQNEVIVNVTNDNTEHSILDENSIDNAISDDAPVPTVADSETKDSADAEINSPIENNVPESPNQSSILGGGLQGRESGARASLAAKFGGSTASELAVENGLKWLVNHQFPDGSWRLIFSKGPCQGQCRNNGASESTTAATGLALMAFLGAGYTQQSGPYQTEIQSGIDYLKSRMRKSIFGGNLGQGNKPMYAHGISTIALSEAYSMTRDETLIETIQLAVEYIITAQHSRGGWRYTPSQPGDITVTAWQIMAIKSAETAGLDIPAETIRKAKTFLMSVSDPSSGYFGYMGPKKTATPTAIGLLLQLYLGKSMQHRAMNEGTKYISKLGPSANDIYFNYYATLLMFHAQHEDWPVWNTKMRDYLIQSQEQVGHQAGSWFYKEQHGSVGGRLYTTAMAIM
ncbi:MAG: prenyltransferase/squalene oxidase repeat-containing protein, partial [Planctomycetota bacterium]